MFVFSVEVCVNNPEFSFYDLLYWVVKYRWEEVSSVRGSGWYSVFDGN